MTPDAPAPTPTRDPSSAADAPVTVVDEPVSATPPGPSVEPAPPAASTGRHRILPVLIATSGAVVVGLLTLLWFGLEQRSRGDVGPSTVPFRQAPDFELGLFDGGTFHLSATLASGKPVLVNFWASWCVPCRDEAPLLEAAWRRDHDRVMFVGVDVEDVDRDAHAFLDQYGITYPNGAGDAGSISVAFGLRGVPESYFVATDGHVVRKWSGALTAAGLDQFLGELQRASVGGR